MPIYELRHNQQSLGFSRARNSASAVSSWKEAHPELSNSYVVAFVHHGSVPESLKSPVKRFPFWIKSRYNPQIGTYYTALGQVPVAEIRKLEKSGTLYGSNAYLRFDSEEAYQAKILELKTAGHRIH